MVQAVFFDLYETLITEWKDNQKKAPYLIEGLGIDETTYKNEWTKRVDRRMNGIYPDHQSVLRDILTTLGMPINETIIEKIHHQRVHSKLIPFKVIDSEILHMLRTLKEMKIQIGLISNCTPEEVIGFEESGLASFFNDVVFSYKVKQAKPMPEIYLTACNNLEVYPESSIFIGDGGSNELQGARNIGMKSYQATWFLPSFISEKITGFPKLNKPSEVIGLV